MKKKVCCGDCKYYYALTMTETSIGNVDITEYCDPEKTMKFFGGFIVRVSYTINDLIQCLEYNKHNDCKYYKRKWWKFWVKEK